MILTAHQPSYLPWLGLFYKISMADAFCIFDTVQYSKKGFDNRNLIKTNQGPVWLSVPVESSNHRQRACDEIRIVNNGWERKHFRSILQAYARAPFLADYAGDLERLLVKTHYEFLWELNSAVLEFGLQSFGLAPSIHRGRTLKLSGKGSDLVLSMCRALGAKEYIFGGEGHKYADVGAFMDAGVTPRFSEYSHPTYRQLHGTFLPNMCFLDLLFNVGPESRTVMTLQSPG